MYSLFHPSVELTAFELADSYYKVFAGWLSDPVTIYPDTFGRVEWLRVYRHSLPSFLSALLLLLTSVTIFFTLREVRFVYIKTRAFSFLSILMSH